MFKDDRRRELEQIRDAPGGGARITAIFDDVPGNRHLTFLPASFTQTMIESILLREFPEIFAGPLQASAARAERELQLKDMLLYQEGRERVLGALLTAYGWGRTGRLPEPDSPFDVVQSILAMEFPNG